MQSLTDDNTSRSESQLEETFSQLTGKEQDYSDEENDGGQGLVSRLVAKSTFLQDQRYENVRRMFKDRQQSGQFMFTPDPTLHMHLYNGNMLILEGVDEIKRKFESIQGDRKNQHNLAKNFPKFINLHQQPFESSTRKYSLHSMLQHKFNRVEAKGRLSTLASALYPQKQEEINYFEHSYPEHELQCPEDFETVVRWYTKQTFLYQMVNDLIRVSVDACELFYVQIFFSDLFRAVKYLQQRDGNEMQKPRVRGAGLAMMLPRSKTELAKMYCVYYRVDRMTGEQIQELKALKGSYIEMLGFLSTSRQDLAQTSYTFYGNVKLIIKVKTEAMRKTQKPQSDDHGYADISTYSEHQQEKETLFTPFNIFSVEDYRCEDNMHIFSLSYTNRQEILSASYDSKLYPLKIQCINQREQLKHIVDQYTGIQCCDDEYLERYVNGCFQGFADQECGKQVMEESSAETGDFDAEKVPVDLLDMQLRTVTRDFGSYMWDCFQNMGHSLKSFKSIIDRSSIKQKESTSFCRNSMAQKMIEISSLISEDNPYKEASLIQKLTDLYDINIKKLSSETQPELASEMPSTELDRSTKGHLRNLLTLQKYYIQAKVMLSKDEKDGRKLFQEIISYMEKENLQKHHRIFLGAHWEVVFSLEREFLPAAKQRARAEELEKAYAPVIGWKAGFDCREEKYQQGGRFLIQRELLEGSKMFSARDVPQNILCFREQFLSRLNKQIDYFHNQKNKQSPNYQLFIQKLHFPLLKVLSLFSTESSHIYPLSQKIKALLFHSRDLQHSSTLQYLVKLCQILHYLQMHDRQIPQRKVINFLRAKSVIMKDQYVICLLHHVKQINKKLKQLTVGLICTRKMKMRVRRKFKTRKYLIEQ